jgi:hypothetical protein
MNGISRDWKFALRRFPMIGTAGKWRLDAVGLTMARTFLAALLVVPAAHAKLFKLGDARIIPEPKPGLPPYDYAPDGHYAVLRTGDALTMFWPAAESYRTTGASVFEMHGCTKVLPMGGPTDFDNGGSWLYSVFAKGDRRMLGFYHAEDHIFSGSPESTWMAYKSIARCTSDDLGQTWSNRIQILTSHEPKPDKATWSGLGDHCVVWDEKSRRYFCFFQEGAALCMAVSDDPDGMPGTWKKWFEDGFTEPGLGGRATPIATFAKLRGGNPSLIWNTFLERWVIAWHTWVGDLWISTSPDLVHWDAPQMLLKRTSEKGKLWYPTFVGETDKTGGQNVLLLYADFPEKTSARRHFTARELTFQKEHP